MPAYRPLIERFNEKFIPVPEAGCWIWTAACDADGYARIQVGKKFAKASRVSYELHVGKIPEGMNVCHTCDTPECVNPNHLFVGTQGDNVRDMANKGRHQSQKKTHCLRGHELSGENLYQHKGKRHCRECRRQNDKVRREKRG